MSVAVFNVHVTAALPSNTLPLSPVPAVCALFTLFAVAALPALVAYVALLEYVLIPEPIAA